MLAKELDALSLALEKPKRPLIAIVGGSKVSTKLTVLESLADKVDQLIVGGGIANTFIAAAGHAVGKSLYEEDLLADAAALMRKAEARGTAIPVPTDVVCATEFSADSEAVIRKVSDVQPDEMILDIGPETAAHYAELLKGCLLYTSPSPRDLSTSRMPSSA